MCTQNTGMARLARTFTNPDTKLNPYISTLMIIVLSTYISRNSQEMEHIQKLIEDRKETTRSCGDDIQKIQEVVKMLVTGLHALHLVINPHTILATDPATALQNIQSDLKNIIAERINLQELIGVMIFYVSIYKAL